MTWDALVWAAIWFLFSVAVFVVLIGLWGAWDRWRRP